MEITVAGTAQDLHLIPSYTMVKHHDTTKSAAKVQKYAGFALNNK